MASAGDDGAQPGSAVPAVRARQDRGSARAWAGRRFFPETGLDQGAELGRAAVQAGRLVQYRKRRRRCDPHQTGVATGRVGGQRAEREHSIAGVTGRSRICSGAMNCGEPTIMPLRVSAVASSARAIPKSITRGPSARAHIGRLEVAATTPAAWMAWSASATPAISRKPSPRASAPSRDRLLQRRPRHVRRHQPRRRRGASASSNCAVNSP